MKKDYIIKIDDNPVNAFSFGCCAHVAIASAFDIHIRSLDIILDLMKIRKHEEGLTYYQCVKIINFLCKKFGKKSEYIPNVGITFGQYVYFHKTGKHLVMFDEHLSYIKDGIVYDSYFRNRQFVEEEIKVLNRKPTGFWKIRF